QIVESTPSRRRRYYLDRITDAGSVPCSATKQAKRRLRTSFFMPEIPRPRPLPTARQQDALPKQGVVSLQLRARHGAPASGEGQEALLVGHEGLLAELALMGAERHLRAQLPGRRHVPGPGHGLVHHRVVVLQAGAD